VGGFADNSNAGAAWVFTRSGGTWSQQAYVKASNTGANDGFGYSVALSADGSMLAVAAFPTAAIGLFALVSGALSLLCHWALEAPTSLSLRDGLLLALMGLGPLGGAFYLWDKALKLGDARQIGILSYLTPLGSTAMLILVTGRQWSWSIALAALMIMLAALLGTRAR
jgi:drug/metabolite transporter (DMT)-like permease